MRRQPFLQREAQAALLGLFARLALIVGGVTLGVVGFTGGAEALAEAAPGAPVSGIKLVLAGTIGVGLAVYSLVRPRLAFLAAFAGVLAILVLAAIFGLAPVWAAAFSGLWLLAGLTAREREGELA